MFVAWLLSIVIRIRKYEIFCLEFQAKRILTENLSSHQLHSSVDKKKNFRYVKSFDD